MFIIKTRKNSHPQPFSYYEIKILEVKSQPSQKALVSEQNQQNYLKLRLGTANTICVQGRSKTLAHIKKEKVIPFEMNYNLAYKKIFSQKNLFHLMGGNI
ncbi:unnamed protein product [Paramecium pentaurelia]|uniref:Uncharacterized protein n=1 Tax=Paramecium pentaurelia TaxID=43138 RepID=A0A8S1RWE1_9CILI|nr:unnamed protein product [Paramecium pentaurelia]